LLLLIDLLATVISFNSDQLLATDNTYSKTVSAFSFAQDDAAKIFLKWNYLSSAWYQLCGQLNWI